MTASLAAVARLAGLEGGGGVVAVQTSQGCGEDLAIGKLIAQDLRGRGHCGEQAERQRHASQAQPAAEAEAASGAMACAASFHSVS